MATADAASDGINGRSDLSNVGADVAMNAPVNVLPASLAELYRRQREALLAEFPDIDETTLADTLEGNSMLPEIIAGLVRAAREDDATVAALKSMIGDMQERKGRMERRAEKRRDMAFHLMDAAGIGKLEQPDFSASLRRNPAKVIITDEATIPDKFCRVSRLPNINDIREALKNNVVIPGATLSNGSGYSLSIRVK